MAEMTKYSMEHQLGCGLGGIFQLRSFWPRKKSIHSIPAETNISVLKMPVTDHHSKKPPVYNSKQKPSNSETVLVDISDLSSQKAHLKHPRKQNLAPHQKNERRRPSDAGRSSTSSSPREAKLRKDSTSESRALSSIVTINDQQQFKGGKALTRATSSNIMLLSHLGNLRQLGNGSTTGNNTPNSSIKTADYIRKNFQEVNSLSRPRNGNSKLGSNGVLGNIVRQSSAELQVQRCQSRTKKMDPEVLKNLGNEKYKQGRYEEALALYDRAIALDSSKATYRSNRSAALIGLGRFIEAVADCKEAIRIDPSYHKARQRLATLYIRLGEVEKALYQYEQTGLSAHSRDIAQAEAVQKHLNRCIEARKLKDWNTLLRETESSISSGADLAPQVYTMQAEALLKLHRHEEAYTTYKKGPHFCMDSCIKFFGLPCTSHLLTIGAQIYLAAGRFQDALTAAQQAARLDPSNNEANSVVNRARTVSSARLSGNLLFKASKFSEACIVYSEGLENDPHNSILLCNRAACRSKLGQFEKAVEDCTAALKLQPNYSKARLRRADCNVKLGRWEAAIQDYEMLIRESPADEEVGRALFEAQVELKKQRGEETEGLKFGSNLVFISSNERFRHFVTSPGMSVVLFYNKGRHKQVLQLMEQVCRRFPSVNFLKVEVEDHPYLAKTENVTSIPSFRIYKNGSKVKEIPGNNRELLEKSVKLYSR